MNSIAYDQYIDNDYAVENWHVKVYANVRSVASFQSRTLEYVAKAVEGIAHQRWLKGLPTRKYIAKRGLETVAKTF